MTFRDLEPAQALKDLRSEATLRVLDVRTKPEYDAYHIRDAVLVPIQDLQERLQELDSAGSWLVTCEHGVRSMAACEFLASIGFQDIRNVSGGMARWIGEGLPLDPSEE